MVPSRGFRSERGGGSRVERLGRIAIGYEADMSVALTLATSVKKSTVDQAREVLYVTSKP